MLLILLPAILMSEKGEKMLRTKIVSTILKENLDQNVLRPFVIWHIPVQAFWTVMLLFVLIL